MNKQVNKEIKKGGEKKEIEKKGGNGEEEIWGEEIDDIWGKNKEGNKYKRYII